MRRTLLIALGLLSLAVSALWCPAVAQGPSWVSALGRSLGGTRVLASNALYLRAEQLESEGRLEDAAAALDLLLELDPRNEAATAYLVDVYARALLPQVAGEENRLAWWREAFRLLQRSLREFPQSARLQLAAADLLLLPPPAVAAALERAEPARLGVGLAYLLEAARLTAEVPRAGRRHLIQATSLGPLLAAQALAAGDLESAGALMRDLEEMQELRAPVLAEVAFDPEAQGEGPSLLAALARMLSATREVLGALKGGDRQAAQAQIDGLEPALGPRAKALAGVLGEALHGS